MWEGWLARGKVEILAGPPGTGKTTLAVALAAALSCGGRWPDGTMAPIGETLIWSGEDDPADTLLPRFLACGGDPRRLRFVTNTRDADGKRPFDPAGDTPALLDALRSRPPALLIVDPVVSAVAGDSHKNGETRRALQPLVDLARELGTCVLGISHFSKGSAGRLPVDRVAGSLAFGALARVVLGAVKLPDSDEGDHSRIFCRLKSNLGPDDGGFGYDLGQVELDGHPGVFASRVLWTGQVAGEAHEILGRADAIGTDDEDRSNAEAFLVEELGNGPVATKDLQKGARDAGIGWRSVERAKKKLGVVARKRAFASGWEWAMLDEDNRQDRAKTATPKARRSSRSSVEAPWRPRKHRRPPRPP